MFSNIAYFITALLIIVAYVPPREPYRFPGFDIGIFLFLHILFFLAVSFSFRKLENQAEQMGSISSDRLFNSLVTRFSILAIVLFSIDLYWFNLPVLLRHFSVFTLFPTLQSLSLLFLFSCFFALIWGYAHGAYRKIYKNYISKRSYIFSNLSFAVPVLIPWLIFSFTNDIIEFLPFDLPKRMLATAGGQVVFFFLFLSLIVITGPLLIQKFWGCRPLETGDARDRIDRLCRRAGVGYANILYWPVFGGRMITAGVMGLVKQFRFILVTEALLSVLGPGEIDAVIAHEIGHVKKKHLLLYLVIFLGFYLICIVGNKLVFYCILTMGLLVDAFTDPILGLINAFLSGEGAMASGIAVLLLMLSSLLLYFRFIFGYFMRNFERQADAYVYSLFHTAEPLISTFEKIVITSGQAPDKPNWHHFSIRERVDYLKKCESDKKWIRRQDSKIRKSMIAYFGIMGILAFFGYQLEFGETGKRLDDHFFEKYLIAEVVKNPNNSKVFGLLGDYYQSKMRYSEAISAYENSLHIDPDDPRILNNLAWLLATCEKKKFRDSGKAVTLAEKAVMIRETDFILDTLAESYYADGRYSDALAAGKRALKLARENMALYEKKLKKYREAAQKE